jgi:Dolichyl-phosphate-mannose-protein mannosyltransferase
MDRHTPRFAGVTPNTTEPSPDSVTLRSASSCALPALVLAALLLLPFLNNAFTIDDPTFLAEAKHVLTDPLHPQAFDMVWDRDVVARASEMFPGALAAPYWLIPTVLAGSPEIVGHLTTLLFLLLAILSTALIALRLGLSRADVRLTTLLVALCPAVLGMSGTIMPDVPCMAFATLGMERILAWKSDRRWPLALAAIGWLTLAALTRAHTLLLLIPAAVLLLDGMTPGELRSSFATFRARFVPVLLVPLTYFAISTILSDPQMSLANGNVSDSLLEWHRARVIFENGVAFLVHWVVVVPLALPWLVLRFRVLSKYAIVAGMLAGATLAQRAGWAGWAAGLAILVLLDIVLDAWARRDQVHLVLSLWLWIAIPIVIYVHLPAKYLLPSVPAVALLLVRHASAHRQEIARWLIPVTLCCSAILGVLILIGVRDLADIQRRAVADLVVPQLQQGRRVWLSGHWGFQWYGEKAGAVPATMDPPLPASGDIIVVSEIDFPLFPSHWLSRQILQTKVYPGNGISRVMDLEGGAGFFSNGRGYLPWVWGSGSSNRFQVWLVP